MLVTKQNIYIVQERKKLKEHKTIIPSKITPMDTHYTYIINNPTLS